MVLFFAGIQQLTSNIQVFGAFEPLGYGAAAKGMGGAYTAAAADGSAAYWNPAGLALAPSAELSASWEDVYGLGILRYNTVGYTKPNLGGGTVSLNLLHLQTTGEASFFKYAENTYLVAYGRHFWKLLYAGAGLRYYAITSDKKASGIGYDAGLLFQSAQDRLRLGFAAQDLNQPRIRWVTGARDVLPVTFRAGALLKLGPVSEFAAEQAWRSGEKRTLRLGTAHHFMNRAFSVRAGMHRVQGQGQWNPSLGGGLRLGRFDVDYAWENQDDLGNSQNVSLSLRFGP